MNQGENIFSEDEIELRTYLLILFQRRWMILAAVVIAVAGAWLTNPEIPGPVYESRVRLMVVPSVSDGLLNGGTGTSFAGRMSADTLSAWPKGMTCH